MEKITRWSPDTCGCVIEIDWDTDTPNVQSHRLVSPCPCHQNCTGSDVLIENQTKNKAMQIVAETNADLAQLTDGGQVIPNLSKLSFCYDSNRKLTILTKGAVVDYSQIQTELDKKLGTGSVSIG